MKRNTLLVVFLASLISLCSCTSASEQMNGSDSSKNVVALFQKLPIDQSDRDYDVIHGTDAAKNASLKQKYETEYSLYSHGEALGKAAGKIKERGYDNFWDVSLPIDCSLALSQAYNPYPRKAIYSNTGFDKALTDTLLTDVSNRFGVKAEMKSLCTIDLDNDGKNESIAYVANEEKRFLAQCLLDSDYKVIAYLMVVNDGNKEIIVGMDYKELIDYYDPKSSNEIADINNDGVMEIITQLPLYEGFDFKVFTYKNGTFDSDFITSCTFHY